MTAKSSFALLMPVFSPSPPVTFPTEKYIIQITLYLKRHRDKFCMKARIQSLVKHKAQHTLTKTVVFNIYMICSSHAFRPFHLFQSLGSGLGYFTLC
jgi:hypothetical protein